MQTTLTANIDLSDEELWPFESTEEFNAFVRDIVRRRISYHLKKEVDAFFAAEAHNFAHQIAQRIRDMETLPAEDLFMR